MKGRKRSRTTLVSESSMVEICGDEMMVGFEESKHSVSSLNLNQQTIASEKVVTRVQQRNKRIISQMFILRPIPNRFKLFLLVVSFAYQGTW